MTKDNRRCRPCFSEVLGHARAIIALEQIAVTRQSLLFAGRPGSGGTLLARRLPAILPPDGEAPFRAPHYTCSRQALLAEVEIAKDGVLFLDEIPLFNLDHVEEAMALAKELQVIVVGYMFGCPCGQRSMFEECACLPEELERWKQASIRLNRMFDRHHTLQMCGNKPHHEASDTMRARVARLRPVYAQDWEARNRGKADRSSVGKWIVAINYVGDADDPSWREVHGHAFETREDAELWAHLYASRSISDQFDIKLPIILKVEGIDE